MDAEADIVIDGIRNNGFFGEDVANQVKPERRRVMLRHRKCCRNAERQ